MLGLPNLLATRNGRLGAFFALYITEGIPLGFAATAVATQLRRLGVGPAEIGAFVGLFYLPWAFKWISGPFVDVFRSRRFGHRRAWIIGTQAIMVITVLALIPVELPSQLWLFSAILVVHNFAGAVQDVAIDSLAVATLSEDERGLANGLMFAGASVGQAVGGSGVLFLMPYVGMTGGIIFVAIALLAVITFVGLPMKEALVAGLETQASSLREAGRQMRKFSVDAFRSFVGTPGAFRGVFFSLLPAGAMSLGLALQSNLAVEFGMSDEAIALQTLWSMIISSVCMVVGGMLSDKLGRRRMLALYLAGMSFPVLYLMWVLQSKGYVMPRAPGGAPMPELITVLWIATLTYSVFQGLMYGTRSAIMMDVTNPVVAATQFTAYMAMMNLAIAIAATWQGIAVEAWGYPTTLLVDAITGPLCILLLPAMYKRSEGFTDALAAGRASRTALVLGLLLIAWIPYWLLRDVFGKAQPIVGGTFYSLVFIASALYLFAGREVLGASIGRSRAFAVWLAIGLVAMYGRNFLDKLAGMPALVSVIEAVMLAVPLAAGLLLVNMSRRNWDAVKGEEGAIHAGT